MGTQKQQIVKLQYFKASGKWYESGDFYVDCGIELYEIWRIVINRARIGHLPGLRISSTPYKYFITVDVPGHPNEHPHMIIPEVI